MLFVLKRTPFDKLFVKQALYSKFASFHTVQVKKKKIILSQQRLG